MSLIKGKPIKRKELSFTGASSFALRRPFSRCRQRVLDRIIQRRLGDDGKLECIPGPWHREYRYFQRRQL